LPAVVYHPAAPSASSLWPDSSTVERETGQTREVHAIGKLLLTPSTGPGAEAEYALFDSRAGGTCSGQCFASSASCAAAQA
jgi:hypothetical protein